MGHSWVTRDTGQLTDGSRRSWVINCDPLSALTALHRKIVGSASAVLCLSKTLLMTDIIFLDVYQAHYKMHDDDDNDE